jgi:hypothetical protein
MKEGNIQNTIRLAVSKFGGAFALRNNTGLAWTGSRVIKNTDGSITILNPRPFHGGLCTGSSDLIGMAEHTVTAEDVGRKVGLFLALEVKTESGRASDEQKAFLTRVSELGGLASIVRSDDDAISVLSQKWDSPAIYKSTKRRDHEQ